MSGLISGLGAATADGLYAIVAAFGLTVVSDIMIGNLVLLRILGGVFLVYLGVRIFLSIPEKKADSPDTGNLSSDYWTTFFLTLTNPMTILSFTAIVAVLGGSSPQGDSLSSVAIVIGVIAGSAAWWIILASGVTVMRSGINDRLLVLVNRVSGIIIVLFGIIAFAVTLV